MRIQDGTGAMGGNIYARLLTAILEGRGLHEHIVPRIIDRYDGVVVARTIEESSSRGIPMWQYIVENCTNEIANTKIAREIHKDDIIMPYSDDAETIRVLINVAENN